MFVHMYLPPQLHEPWGFCASGAAEEPETECCDQCPHVWWTDQQFTMSRSPKAGHNKASRSDFRNQQFKPDTAKMQKMQKVLLTPENKALRRFHRPKTRKTQKIRKMRRRKRGKCGKCGKCGWLALMWLALGDPHYVFIMVQTVLDSHQSAGQHVFFARSPGSGKTILMTEVLRGESAAT